MIFSSETASSGSKTRTDDDAHFFLALARTKWRRRRRTYQAT
jgi:hypothetical protein